MPQPDKVTCLNDLAPVIELYHHTIQAGQIEDAERLLHDRLIPAPLVYQFGAYELCIDMVRLLFPDGEDYTPHLTDEGSQALAMNSLAALYNLSGQPRRAIPLLKRQIAIREKQGLKMNVGIGLGNAANSQIAIGELRAAEVNLRRRIGLCREIEDDLGEAIGHQELGWLLGCRGAYAKSETEIAAAMRMFKKRKNLQGQGINWAYRTLCELLLLRCKPSVAKHQTVIEGARNALKLSEAREHSIGRPNVGLALGGQTYSEFLFFEGTEALHRFKYQDLTFAAQASAVALKSGAAANARYDDGIAVFTLVHEGLMFEASIGGQHISYEPR